ncbi:MAG: hypothetical protein HY518_03070, partial [Candidatus Aenigmarchaeota archaeon]|nr:hypothetical protein [Candidatus Aenigmarchaeota archaeon]
MDVELPGYLDAELAEVFGIVAGDGYASTRLRWLFVETSAEEKIYIDNHVIPLFNSVFKTNLKGRFFNRNGIKNTYGFYICSKKLALFLDSFNLAMSHNYIRIPKEVIFNRDPNILASFMRGYIDTDGCLSFYKNSHGTYSYPRITLLSTSENLIYDCIRLLEKLGFKGSHWINKKYKKSWRDGHKYELKGNSMLSKWMELIGFKNPVKFSKFLIWKK